MNFEEWLTNNAPTGMEEAYCLWRASFGEVIGIYTGSAKNDKVYIKGAGPDADTLALVSPEAKEAFRKLIERYNPYPDLGWEGGQHYASQMAKKD